MNQHNQIASSNQKNNDILSKISIHAGLIICVCFQRFGISSGASFFFFCVPAYYLLLIWMAINKNIKFSFKASAAFIGLMAWCLVSTIISLIFPDFRFGFSAASLFLVAILYAIFCVETTDKFKSDLVLPILLFYARLCSVLGLIQYFLQFAGIETFSFMMMIPALKPVLVEEFYAYYPILQYGSSIVRSNGFFFLEPSMFSQFIAIAILVDLLIYKNYKWMPLYLVAYIYTYSGTGVVILMGALILYVLLNFSKAWKITVLAIPAAAVLMIGSVIFPSQFERFTARSSELQATGSSGYARYLGQMQMFNAYGSETRMLIGYGPGATERSDNYFKGSGNPLLKLTIDYGIIGFIIFCVFLVIATWQKDIMILPLISYSMLQLGGGNFQFPPDVILIHMLCMWTVKPKVKSFAS